MTFRSLITIFVTFLFIISTPATISYAQQVPTPSTAGEYQLLTPIPAGENGSTTGTINIKDPLGYIQGLFRIFVAVAIALSVVILAYGGITYMTSDAVTLKNKGKEIIKRALWGLLLLLTSFLIINTINPNALNLDRLFQTGYTDPKVPGDTTPGTDTQNKFYCYSYITNANHWKCFGNNQQQACEQARVADKNTGDLACQLKDKDITS